MSIWEREGGSSPRTHGLTDGGSSSRILFSAFEATRWTMAVEGGGVEIADRPSWAVERSCRGCEKVSRGSGRSRDCGSEG